MGPHPPVPILSAAPVSVLPPPKTSSYDRGSQSRCPNEPEPPEPPEPPENLQISSVDLFDVLKSCEFHLFGIPILDPWKVESYCLIGSSKTHLLERPAGLVTSCNRFFHNRSAPNWIKLQSNGIVDIILTKFYLENNDCNIVDIIYFTSLVCLIDKNPGVSHVSFVKTSKRLLRSGQIAVGLMETDGNRWKPMG